MRNLTFAIAQNKKFKRNATSAIAQSTTRGTTRILPREDLNPKLKVACVKKVPNGIRVNKV